MLSLNINFSYLILQKIANRFNFRAGGNLMESKLLKQFYLFLTLLFAWTIILLLIGPK